MNDLDRLALAHALRTPLTSALLAVGLLGDGAVGPLTTAQSRVLGALHEDLDRLRLLVDRGLDVERLGSYAGPLERSALELSALLARATDPLRPQALERGLEIEVDGGRGLKVVADPIKATWALATLVGNAIRYANARVEIRVASSDDEIRITVRDDGPGIGPNLLDRLFARDGAGLSLYLVREIVEAHGGSIEAVSTKVAGTSFVVQLPRAEAR